jgi:DNA-binding transcriptional LysR family regulator
MIAKVGTRMVDWDDIRYFLNAVRAGSYTAAGERLNVNRTTIGRRLAHFEDALRIALYEQTDEGYRPTPAGYIILESGREIERITDDMIERLTSVRGSRSGIVRVVASAGIGTEFLPQILAFRALFPDIRIEMIYATDVIRCIAHRKADLAICLTDARPGHLRGPRVCELEQALYASEACVARRPADPGHERIGWGHEMASLPDRWVKSNVTAEGGAVLEVNSWTDLIGAVRMGIGAAWLWRFSADNTDDLVRLSTTEPAYTTSLWLLHRADVPLDPPARALSDFLAAKISGQCAAGVGAALEYAASA